MPESSGDFLTRLGTDAEKWAIEFIKAASGLNLNELIDSSPGGFVFGWFANAISAGESSAISDGGFDEVEQWGKEYE